VSLAYFRKEGEVVKGFDKDFTYEEASLAGAVFEVYASEVVLKIHLDDQVTADRIFLVCGITVYLDFHGIGAVGICRTSDYLSIHYGT